MTPQIWAALITAAAALAAAVAGLLSSGRAARRARINAESLELLRAQLTDRTSTQNAWREYEFDARKRLYEACAPLMFQLAERGERALGSIYGLARTAAAGDLDQGQSWLAKSGGYYSLSTYYRLLAPLSTGLLLRRRLTQVDLSIEPGVHRMYRLVRALTDSFTDDFELAGKSPGSVVAPHDQLEYAPHTPQGGRRLPSTISWQQGIPRGLLDDALTGMLVGNERVMEFSEFQAAYNNESSAAHSALHRIDYLFRGFHPRSRPVLWRVLVSQAYLYEALVASPRHGGGDAEVIMGRLDLGRLDWRSETDSAAGSEVEQAVRVAADYVRRRDESSAPPSPTE